MGIYRPQHSGFPEIGGAGEVIYTSVRFSGYTLEYDRNGEYFHPIADEDHRPVAKVDYEIRGHEILYSLANLYRELNRPEKTVDARGKVIGWCTSHIHPFNIRNLAALCSSDEEKDELDWKQIRREGSFSFQDFMKELHKLASTTDYHHALKSVMLSRNTSLARRLYYEGTYEDGLSFFEKYRRLPDEEYLESVSSDYPYHIGNILEFVPHFEMSLQQDRETGRIGLYAFIDSVFDIAWFALSRAIASDAPPQDSDDDTPLYTNIPYICCKACGTYVLREGLRQQYCKNPKCQKVRNRKKQQDHYDRNRMKKMETNARGQT